MPFLCCFSSFIGELCPGLVLVSSPVVKCTYKQHRYRNKSISTGSIYAWALSVGGAGSPLTIDPSLIYLRGPNPTHPIVVWKRLEE